MIKPKRMRWVGYVEQMEKSNAYGYWWENQRERDY
jgi:hypothetical protein